MEGSMHMRRKEDGYMHRRMQKTKHMQGNDLDTPTSCFCQLKAGTTYGEHVNSSLGDCIISTISTPTM